MNSLREEIERYERAARDAIARLSAAVGPAAQEACEAECLHHLGALHDLFIESMEWDRINAYTCDLQNVASPRIRSWLSFFQGYADIRVGAVGRGLAAMDRLLADPELEPALRLRALHAAHIAYVSLSRYDCALELLREALPLTRQLGDQARRSYLLLSIAQLYGDLADHRRALRLCRRSLRLARAAGAIYREVHALYEVGNNALHLGHWEEAAAALAAADGAYRGLGMTRRLAMIRWAQGTLALLRGNYEQSALALGEALALAEDERGSNALAAVDSLAQLGLLALVQGDEAGAMDRFSRAESLARRHEIRHWRPLLQGRIAALLARAGRAGEAEALWRAAIDEVETLRAGIAAEDLRVGLFGTTQYLYESLVLFLLERGDLAAAFGYVERARSRAFLDLLAARPAEDGEGQVADRLATVGVATLAELQRQLEPGEVVLEFFTTGVRPWGEHWLNKIPATNQALLRAALAPPATLLFVITREGIICRRLRDGAMDLDPNKLRPSAHSDDPVLDMLRTERAVDWLSQRLLAPVEQQLVGCRRICIIPHGPLHYIPFAALRRADGSFLLRAGGPAIAHAPSASIMLHTRRERPARRGGALAIGYDGPEGARLEHAEDEAVAVARLLDGTAWVGPEPKSTRLLEHGEALRWLHIAGHTTQGRNQTPGLHLGAGDVLSAAAVLRAGPGCRAELVTLSACMSGFGQVLAGDELFGLQRAFLYAVAPTIICTMARARDRVALLMMEQLYTRLLADDGQGPAAALCDALVAVRELTRAEVDRALARHGYPPLPEGGPPDERPFAHPQYWAPFVLIGRP